MREAESTYEIHRITNNKILLGMMYNMCDNWRGNAPKQAKSFIIYVLNPLIGFLIFFPLLPISPLDILIW